MVDFLHFQTTVVQEKITHFQGSVQFYFRYMHNYAWVYKYTKKPEVKTRMFTLTSNKKKEKKKTVKEEKGWRWHHFAIQVWKYISTNFPFEEKLLL